jgi:hypothetical protein
MPRPSVPLQNPTTDLQGAQPSTAPAGAPATLPGSTRNADTKKSEKVKDFYSSLLNKKKDKNRVTGKQPPTPSNGEAPVQEDNE